MNPCRRLVSGGSIASTQRVGYFSGLGVIIVIPKTEPTMIMTMPIGTNGSPALASRLPWLHACPGFTPALASR